MSAYKRKPDPLHDGTIGSYVGRFAICFILGLFGCFGLMVAAPRLVLNAWLLFLLVPVATGVVGIFAFDRVTKVFDKWSEDQTSDYR